MQIRVLGPLEVVDGGRRIEIRRPMERALLTILAAEAGRVVSTDRLADGLWGGSPPATAIKTVQTYIHHLRRLLPPGTIATVGSGYRLDVDPMDVDAHRFVAEASGDRDGAETRRLTGALQWRGTPFADAEDAEALRPLRTRLESLRLATQAAALADAVEIGRHEEAIPELRAMLAEHPLREDLWAIYMLALYRSGRQADALRAFTEARQQLGTELGIEPGPELRLLEDRILAQDPTLVTLRTAPPAEAAPTFDPGAAPPEQRLATLVAADLVGLDELDAAAGRDTGDRVGAEAVATIIARLESLGGTVIRRDTRSVTAAYGVPVARDDDTYRALRAALAVAADVAETGRHVARSWPGGRLAARCAVATTQVIVPIDEEAAGVARLDDLLTAAGAGEVVADDHTHRLVSDLFTWGEVAVPGLTLWQVGGVRAPADKARMGRRLGGPFIGRGTELASAVVALDALGRGVGGILVVTGEAGVGKTRLVSELCDVDRVAATWLTGHCAAYGEAMPYTPFRDLLRSWLDLGVDDTDLKARVALREALERLFGEESDAVYPYLAAMLGIGVDPHDARRLQLAPESLQYRTFEVIAATLTALAADEPLVVVVEDVHWADPTSLQLIGELLSLTERHAILVVVTGRPDPDHGSRRLIDSARSRHPHLVREISLEVLGDDAQSVLLDALVGAGTLPAETRHDILRLAEGNPFYLEELVGSLVDGGALRPATGGWAFDHHAAVTVPETVEKVVQARIDRLDRRSHDLLTAASVLGRSFGLPLLQGLAGDSVGVMDALSDLLRLGLLHEARRWPHSEYLFKHALIQEAAYRTLPAGRRADLHRRAAEWLETRYQGSSDEVAGQLARHWAAGGDEDRAARALLRAGDLARRDHALDEAIGHYRELLPMLERRDDRRAMALVLFKLGLALHTSLRFAESNEAYGRAFELWESPPTTPATATLRFAGPPFFDVPDPVRSYALQDIQLQMALFDRLVERWPDDTIVPSLAERWEISDDGLCYRFTLREGLAWSDGEPLTAADVVYGIMRNLHPDRPGISVAMLYVLEGAHDHVSGRGGRVGVEAVDERTVEFRLDAPAPYLLGMLNRPDCGPQPRHAIERLGDGWADISNEVVSGAFHRRRHDASGVVLERRADYQGTRIGNVRVVEWHNGLKEEATGAYAAGDVDLLWMPATWAGPAVERFPDEQRRLAPPAGLIYLVPRCSGPLGDARLRLALGHAIDRSALARVMPRHWTAAAGGVVPPPLAGHTPDVGLRFDPDRARALLASAGPLPGLRVAALDPPLVFEPNVMEAVVAMWRDHLGIAVEVVGLDRAAYNALYGDMGTFDIIVSWWYPGYTDPEYFLRLLLHSEAADNFGGFSHPSFDELVELARQERDERTRLGLFHRADRMAVAEMAAIIPLAYSQNIVVSRPAVDGWWEFGKSWANFADLTVTDR